MPPSQVLAACITAWPQCTQLGMHVQATSWVEPDEVKVEFSEDDIKPQVTGSCLVYRPCLHISAAPLILSLHSILATVTPDDSAAVAFVSADQSACPTVSLLHHMHFDSSCPEKACLQDTAQPAASAVKQEDGTGEAQDSGSCLCLTAWQTMHTSSRPGCEASSSSAHASLCLLQASS